jgi:hypothetical protein
VIKAVKIFAAVFENQKIENVLFWGAGVLCHDRSHGGRA